MDVIRRSKIIKLDDFGVSVEQPSVKYGLPTDINFCTRCVMSNQRPNSTVEFLSKSVDKKSTITFNADGVCDACLVAELKATVDWKSRLDELRALCDKFRCRKRERYDCVVPGSGGKDSFYAAHFLKFEMDMNPITVTWAPNMFTDWGWRNHQAWINAGFDNILITPSKRTHRVLTRLATEVLLHPFQPFMIGQKTIASKIAEKYDIPLIFYGENEAEYGNPSRSYNDAKRDIAFSSTSDWSNISFGGVSLADLQSEFGLTLSDLHFYLPQSIETVKKLGIETHYLGYYLKWHPQSCFYYSVENGGFQPSPERTPGTYSKYNSIDDKIDDFHYYTTGVKFGIGRATYDASQEVRSGDINREEALALVKRYDHEFPKRFATEIYDYLSLPPDEFPKASKMFEQPMMNDEYFIELCNSFRSPHIWCLENDRWRLRATPY